jgi:divalent metal cation (Fe/Co/Zn/Cd) transporter
LLARACEGLLVGRQADPRLLERVEKWIEDRDEVLDVVDMLSMVTGTDSVLLCMRVDFVDGLSAGDLEEACVRLDEQLRQELPELNEVFIQPASRRDKALRRRVEARYGRALADD